jgi:hypothetical protein
MYIGAEATIKISEDKLISIAIEIRIFMFRVQNSTTRPCHGSGG